MYFWNVIKSPCFYYFVLAILHEAAIMAVLIVYPTSCWNPSLAYLLGIVGLAVVGFGGITYKLRNEDFWKEFKRNEFEDLKTDWTFRIFWSITVNLLAPAHFSTILVTSTTQVCEEQTPPWILILTMTSCFLTWPWGALKLYILLKSLKGPMKDMVDRKDSINTKKLLLDSIRSPYSLQIFKENYKKVEWPKDYTSSLIMQYIAKHASYRVPETPPKEIDDSFSWDQSQDCLYEDTADIKHMTWNFFHRHTKRCCKVCKRILRRGDIVVDLQCCRHPFSVDRFHLTCLEKVAAATPTIFCYWNEKEMNITELFLKIASN